MENRVVALSVLEDLIHWPLAPRDGSTAPNYSNFYLTGKLSDGKDPGRDDLDDDDELCFVAANAVGDQHLEPRARRQARYRAVLRLPLLCHKLGPRWVTSEVVPYLLRCLEEEDPQLSFVVGMTLLGLVLPTPVDKTNVHAQASNGSSSSNPTPAPAESQKATAKASEERSKVPAYQSYLTLEAVQPVVEALAAARDPCTRHFAAQVVVPHLLFGMSVETSVSYGVGGWEAKYVPQWVLAEAVAQRGADAAGGEGGASADAKSSGGGELGAAAAAAEDDDGGYFERLVAEGYRRYTQRRQGKAGATGASSSTVPRTMGPDPLQLKSDLGFLADEEYTSLCLLQQRNPVLAHCGLREAGAASAAASATTEKRSKQSFMVRVRASGGLTLLRGVPLSLYGAAYADERADAASGPPDYFFLNTKAHTLINDMSAWLEALTSGSSGGRPPSKHAKPGTFVSAPKRALYLSDYLCDDPPPPPTDTPTGKTGKEERAFLSRREALRQRWRTGLAMLGSLLASRQPGTVAVAVEAVSVLLNAIHCVLSGADVAALALASPCVEADHADATPPPIVAKPSAFLKTEAELQAFQYYSTRRHVALCLVAATAPPPAQRSRAAPLSAAEAARVVQTTLAAVRDTLTTLLSGAGILVPMPMASEHEPTKGGRAAAASPAHASLQLGPGPKEVRAGPLSAWDVCFSSHGVAAAIGSSNGGGGGPVDVAHLLLTSTTAAVASTGKAGGAHTNALVGHNGFTTRGAVLYATENMSSVFRQHRTVRMAVLGSLALAVDTAELLRPLTLAASRRAESSLSLDTVCRLLLEVVAPPSMLPTLLKELADDDEAAGKGAAGGRDKGEASAASLSSPTVHMSSFVAAGAEETPASLDFGVMEAALAAAHRLLAEVAVALPALLHRTYQLSLASSAPATAWRTADDSARRSVNRVLRQLFTVVQVCARAGAVCPMWKARWLLARKVAGLVSAYLYVVLRVGQAGQAAAELANRRREQPPAAAAEYASSSSLPSLMAPWYYRVLALLTTLWGSNKSSSSKVNSTAAQQGQNFCAQWIDDEEPEVRCVAPLCATLLFDGMAQAATQIAACEAKQKRGPPPAAVTAAATASDDSTLYLLLLGYTESYEQDLASALDPLLQPLVPFVELVMEACESALLDRQPPVRCAAASALSSVSRTLSALCIVNLVITTTPTVTGRAAVGEAVWKGYLTRATDAMLSLTADASSAVQLTLVAELADLLVTAPAPPPSDKSGATAEGTPSAAQVRHAALLSCLGSLSKHEIWRFRERYAILLCEMTSKFLAPRYLHAATDATAPAAAAGIASSSSSEPRASAIRAGSVEASATGSAGWAHTHPLFRLAREELLPMLVAVLFDKVKAVRDAALDATVALCSRLHNAAAAAAAGHGKLGPSTSGGTGGESSGVAGAGGGAGRLSNGGGDGSGEALSGDDGGANRFVNDVLWPLIRDSPKAWETYLSRSALLRVAVRLRVDKESTLLSLLDQLAHDPVLNVRLVVAKTIHEILVQSGAGGGGGSSNNHNSNSISSSSMSASPFSPVAASPMRGGQASSRGAASARFPTATPRSLAKERDVAQGNDGTGTDAVALPPVVFTEEEKNGVVLKLLRQLLEDASSDVRDEAARALKVCF